MSNLRPMVGRSKTDVSITNEQSLMYQLCRGGTATRPDRVTTLFWDDRMLIYVILLFCTVSDYIGSGTWIVLGASRSRA